MTRSAATARFLYTEFILRDLLTFITPGAILVGAALYMWWGRAIFLSVAASIPWLLYIPIFGVFFVVGFALHVFGILIHPLLDFRFDEPHKAGYADLIAFFKKVGSEQDDVSQIHERFSVFTQMCLNNGLAILFVLAALITRYLAITVLFYGFWVISGVVLLFLLLAGYIIHRKRKKDWETAALGAL